MKRATSRDLGVDTAFMDSLRRAGIVAVVAQAEKVGRGRKNNIYSLTKSGNGKASTLKRKIMA
jgi:predicted ArsR family transcriptional regulator